MIRIEFLLEEPSMKRFLQNLLPRILPPEYKLGENYFLRPHEGRSDLQKSIPKKIQAFNNSKPPVGIFILHDQDSNDCKKLKNDLITLCTKPGNNVKFMVRIVCRELEAWYLGDMNAIEKAYPAFKAKHYINKAIFRNPDEPQAASELKRIVPGFKKTEAAGLIAPHIDIHNNHSRSFKNFILGLNRFISSHIE